VYDLSGLQLLVLLLLLVVVLLLLLPPFPCSMDPK